MSLRMEGTFNLDRLKTDATAALPAGMQTAMEHIKEVSVERTPIEEGTLRRGATAGVEVHGTDVVGFVHYPGPYARRQHEELEYKHPNGGEAKFLETSLFTESDQALKIVANAVREAL